ncbi:unnamed protein product [Rotaria magnacalcarata]|uniref:Uncharacterized protein n=1 Tax=Rotaria magnacalcarata TaxID=392030 RepID=A0A816URN9_9BILA|nr:unnamed protein product [Rotaria magnacalcarata]CAF4104546.1 unnamed protein product [Rotaria magnacalcarata]
MLIPDLTKSLLEQQNTFHTDLDETEVVEQALVNFQDAYNDVWSIMAARKESIVPIRRQQQHQQINNDEPAMITQPRPEDPPLGQLK